MIKYARPSVDNLINNLPGVLKSSRQFLAWAAASDKKIPLRQDGRSWGNYQDPSCWRTFDDVIELLDRNRAFGIGLVLPAPQQVHTLPDFNLIGGLVAFDGDAKRSSIATPYHVPGPISD
jgi:primase-polymerase (primpol)-like protein